MSGIKLIRLEQKKAFIKELAKFLVDNQAGKSINLELFDRRPLMPGIPNWPKEWAELRNAVPGLFGYPTIRETELILKEFLG